MFGKAADAAARGVDESRKSIHESSPEDVVFQESEERTGDQF